MIELLVLFAGTLAAVIGLGWYARRMKNDFVDYLETSKQELAAYYIKEKQDIIQNLPTLTEGIGEQLFGKVRGMVAGAASVVLPVIRRAPAAAQAAPKGSGRKAMLLMNRIAPSSSELFVADADKAIFYSYNERTPPYMVETGRDETNRFVRVVVADNGPGIPLAEREKLFLPYYSTKRRGSGLGLAIVRRIIAEHGGTIDAGDNVPAGTRFTIEIPL